MLRNVRDWDPVVLGLAGEALDGARHSGGFKTAKFDVYGLTVSFTPRIVTIDEVASYARRTCGTCGGNGKFPITLPENRSVEATCGCAGKRFQKSVPMLRDTKTGDWIALDDLKVSGPEV